MRSISRSPVTLVFQKLMVCRFEFFGIPSGLFARCIEVVSIDDVSVRIYSVEKTIADCFKYRNKIGLDVAIETPRTFRERTPKPNRAKLTKFAEINRVLKIMRPYLEA